jgi:hypothetical protein
MISAGLKAKLTSDIPENEKVGLFFSLYLESYSSWVVCPVQSDGRVFGRDPNIKAR